MTTLRYFRDFLFYGNVFIALCAFFLALTSLYLFEVPILENILILIIIFFSTLFVYSYHGHYSYGSSSCLSPRLQWIGENLKVLKSLGTFSLIVIFILLPSITKVQFILLLVTGVISILYSIKIPFGGGFFSLKSIPYIKAFLIAIIWTLTTVVLPLSSYISKVEFMGISKEILPRFLLLFSLEIGFDLRDWNLDKNENVKTLPVLLGINKAKILGFFALLMACISFYYCENWAGLLSGIPAFIFLFLSTSKKDNWGFNFFGDGVLLFYSLLVILFH